MEEVETDDNEDLTDFKTNLILNVVERFSKRTGTAFKCQKKLQSTSGTSQTRTDEGGKPLEEHPTETRKTSIFSVNVFYDRNYILATLLDPRLKHDPFKGMVEFCPVMTGILLKIILLK